MSKAKPELRALPKRFYAAAMLQQNEDIFCITLDGKTVKTPAGNLLRCASQQLAQQIVGEWEAQTTFIDTDSMPLTRLLNIALDRVEADLETLLADICAYCETDLLFYREPARADSEAARALVLLQHQHFDPILEWCSKTHGLTFVLAEGVMPVAQPPATLQKLRSMFAAASGHELAALAMMVPLLGSALLALAVWHGAVTVDEALVAARLDETVQATQWGEDTETTAKWRDKVRDIRAAAFFLTVK